MRKPVSLLFILFVSWYSISAQVASECTTANTAFNSGEKISYKVVYNWNSLWLNAGEASFTVNESVFGSSKVYHVVGEGNSYRSYDWFYKVHDIYESYIDQKTLVRNMNTGEI